MTPSTIDLNAEVEKVLAKFAQKGITNKPVLAVNLLRMQQLRNDGFPLHMYHETLQPQIVQNESQREALVDMGYGERYIRHNWPAFLFRRNMDKKFDLPNPSKGDPGDFIEARVFKSQADLDAESGKRAPKTAVGGWVPKVTMLPAIEDGPSEDPKVTIARLQGELAGSHRQTAQAEEVAVIEKRKPGRPAKVLEEVTA